MPQQVEKTGVVTHIALGDRHSVKSIVISAQNASHIFCNFNTYASKHVQKLNMSHLVT